MKRKVVSLDGFFSVNRAVVGLIDVMLAFHVGCTLRYQASYQYQYNTNKVWSRIVSSSFEYLLQTAFSQLVMEGESASPTVSTLISVVTETFTITIQ